jgi:hypothetical protein
MIGRPNPYTKNINPRRRNPTLVPKSPKMRLEILLEKLETLLSPDMIMKRSLINIHAALKTFGAHVEKRPKEKRIIEYNIIVIIPVEFILTLQSPTHVDGINAATTATHIVRADAFALTEISCTCGPKLGLEGLTD